MAIYVTGTTFKRTEPMNDTFKEKPIVETDKPIEVKKPTSKSYRKIIKGPKTCTPRNPITGRFVSRRQSEPVVQEN